MKYQFYLFSIIVLLFTSCGPSKEELARIEKEKADSIALAVENKIKAEIEFKEKKEMVEKILNELDIRLSNVKERIIKENINLDGIRDFQFGRSQSSKDKQLEEQYKLINDLEERVAAYEKSIKEMQSNKDKYTHAQIKEIFESMGLEM